MRVVHLQNQPKEKKPSKKERDLERGAFLANHLDRFAEKRAERMHGKMLEELSKLSREEIKALTRISI